MRTGHDKTRAVASSDMRLPLPGVQLPWLARALSRSSPALLNRPDCAARARAMARLSGIGPILAGATAPPPTGRGLRASPFAPATLGSRLRFPFSQAVQQSLSHRLPPSPGCPGTVRLPGCPSTVASDGVPKHSWVYRGAQAKLRLPACRLHRASGGPVPANFAPARAPEVIRRSPLRDLVRARPRRTSPAPLDVRRLEP